MVAWAPSNLHLSSYPIILDLLLVIALDETYIYIIFEKTFGRGAPPNKFKTANLSQNFSFAPILGMGRFWETLAVLNSVGGAPRPNLFSDII